MTTPCEVIIYSSNQELASITAKEILQNTKELEKKYNYFSPDSILTKINKRELFILDPKTKDLLQKGKLFYQATQKAFDITIATIKPLYTLKNLEDFELKKEKLQPYIGCEHFEIKKNKIIFDNPFTQIDFGGLVKEYAVDEAVKIVKKRKISSALINFGGDIYAIGTKPNGEKFTIGIKNPQNPTLHLTSIELCDMALTTSANYERSYTIENKSFSHIMNPQEFEADNISVTVISQTALVSGVYSTALMCKSDLKSRYKTIKVNKNMEVMYENFDS